MILILLCETLLFSSSRTAVAAFDVKSKAYSFMPSSRPGHLQTRSADDSNPWYDDQSNRLDVEPSRAQYDLILCSFAKILSARTESNPVARSSSSCLATSWHVAVRSYSSPSLVSPSASPCIIVSMAIMVPAKTEGILPDSNTIDWLSHDGKVVSAVE